MSNWDVRSIPLGRGVNTKPDPRALDVPDMAVVENALFDELGGLKKRSGFAALATEIGPGLASSQGTLSAIRTIEVHRGRLICRTDRLLFEYAPYQSRWSPKAVDFAITSEERAQFHSPEDQFLADRVVLGGVAVMAWTQTNVSSMVVAAADATTGAVVFQPTVIGTGLNRPRLLIAGTKVILLAFNVSAARLDGFALGPTTLATDLGGSATALLTGLSGQQDYDAVASSAGDILVAAANNAGNHVVARITSALAVTSSTKARANVGPIAIAEAPDGKIGIVRADEARVDFLNANLTDTAQVNIAASGGANANQAAAVFRATDLGGGLYSMSTFISVAESQAYNGYFTTRMRAVQTNGAIGGESLIGRMGVGSRAFRHAADDSTWCWLVHGGAVSSNMSGPEDKVSLQNCYMLYRHDGAALPIGGSAAPNNVSSGPWARALRHIGGGHVAVEGYLPGVQEISTGQYVFAGIGRRIVPAGEDTYADKGPYVVTARFDDDAARQSAALGEALYYAGSLPSQWDGSSLVEHGFALSPWLGDALGTSGGSMDASAAYGYEYFWEWSNAAGEREISGTMAEFTFTSGAGGAIDHEVKTLTSTRKREGVADPSIAIFRTEGTPFPSSPLYRVSSLDPNTSGAAANGYLRNSPLDVNGSLGWTDRLADTDLIRNELAYDSRGEPMHDPPPSSDVIAAGAGRVFWANRDDEGRVFASKLWASGLIVAHSDALSITVPQAGGRVTAMTVLDSNLIIGKEDQIYVLPVASGPDNTGGGGWGDVALLASDVGMTGQRALVVTPDGLIFHTRRGFYLLRRSLQLAYVGAPVEDYTSQTFTAATLLPDRHVVVFLASSGKSLAYDYLVGQWSTWSITGLAACVFQGKYTYAVSSTVIRQEDASYQDAGSAYSLIVETPWVKVRDGVRQGFGRVRRVFVLGDQVSTHNLRVRVAYDYELSAGNPAWVDDVTWTPTLTGPGGYQMRHRTSRQKSEAVKIRFEDVDQGQTVRAAAAKFTDLQLEFGLKEKGRRLGAAKEV